MLTDTVCSRPGCPRKLTTKQVREGRANCGMACRAVHDLTIRLEALIEATPDDIKNEMRQELIDELDALAALQRGLDAYDVARHARWTAGLKAKGAAIKARVQP